MIQRIQTLYLAGTLLLSILLFYVPYCSVFIDPSSPKESEQSFLLDNHGIYKIQNQKNELQIPTQMFNLLNLAGMACVGICIFLFKNRKLQMRMAKIAMLIDVFFFSAINYQLFNMADLSGSAGHIRFLTGWYLPLVQILFLVLSIRAIQKDENLVRSADRLR
jgi:hypothetical protein